MATAPGWLQKEPASEDELKWLQNLHGESCQRWKARDTASSHLKGCGKCQESLKNHRDYERRKSKSEKKEDPGGTGLMPGPPGPGAPAQAPGLTPEEKTRSEVRAFLREQGAGEKEIDEAGGNPLRLLDEQKVGDLLKSCPGAMSLLPGWAVAAKQTPPARPADLKELMVAIAEALGLPQLSFVDAMNEPGDLQALGDRLGQFAVAQAQEKLREKSQSTRALAFLITAGEERSVSDAVAAVERWKAAKGNMLLVFKDEPDRLAAYLKENPEACSRLTEWGLQVASGDPNLGRATQPGGQPHQRPMVRVEVDLFEKERMNPDLRSLIRSPRLVKYDAQSILARQNRVPPTQLARQYPTELIKGTATEKKFRFCVFAAGVWFFAKVLYGPDPTFSPLVDQEDWADLGGDPDARGQLSLKHRGSGETLNLYLNDASVWIPNPKSGRQSLALLQEMTGEWSDAWMKSTGGRWAENQLPLRHQREAREPREGAKKRRLGGQGGVSSWNKLIVSAPGKGPREDQER